MQFPMICPLVVTLAVTLGDKSPHGWLRYASESTGLGAVAESRTAYCQVRLLTQALSES